MRIIEIQESIYKQLNEPRSWKIQSTITSVADVDKCKKYKVMHIKRICFHRKYEHLGTWSVPSQILN